MTRYVLFLLLLSNLNPVFAQQITVPAGKDTLQFLLESLLKSNQKIDEVLNEQDRLKKENLNLKYTSWRRDSSDYVIAYATATKAATLSKAISEKTELLKAGIKTDKALLAAASAQSISNSNFPEIMANAAVSMLETSDSAKIKIWKNIVKKIAKNPLLENIMKSNPVTSVVHSVVNLASGWLDQTIEGSKLEKAKIASKEAIKEQKIADFTKRMEIYIRFYDDLNKVNVEFELALNRIQSKYLVVIDSAALYDTQLRTALKTKKFDDNPILAINALFSFKGDPSFDPIGVDSLRKITTKKEVKKVLEIAEKYSYFERMVNDFESEYRSEIISFLSKYDQIINYQSKRDGTNKTLDILDERIIHQVSLALNSAISINQIRLDQIQARLQLDRSN
jgi:hypothetical protein